MWSKSSAFWNKMTKSLALHALVKCCSSVTVTFSESCSKHETFLIISRRNRHILPFLTARLGFLNIFTHFKLKCEAFRFFHKLNTCTKQRCHFLGVDKHILLSYFRACRCLVFDFCHQKCVRNI